MPKAIRVAAILLLVMAALLAIIAIGIGRKADVEGASVASSPATEQPKRVVVVAGKALPAGQTIVAADLSTRELAVGPNEGFSALTEVNGRLPAIDIPAGTMITRALLVQGIAAGIKPGERAIAVPVDELAGVSNRVAPGDFVDVFMSLQSPRSSTGPQTDTTQARLLLSRLRVLGYGQDDVDTQQAASAEISADAAAPEPGSRAETIAARNTSNEAQVQARSAILAVPVEDAGQLLLAAHNGKLFLALRNPGDTAVADQSIFVAPPPVLALRRNLDPSEADTADRPENQAFAGISLAALAGEATATRATTAESGLSSRPRQARPAGRSGIEIIRGNGAANRLSSP